MPAARPLSPFWRMLEDYFRRKYDIRPVEDDPEALVAYNLYAHSGPDVSLQTGEVICRGDLIAEAHFRREALIPLIEDGDARRMGRALLRLGERDLPRLARQMQRDPRLEDVQAIHALTLFHRGIRKLGFEVMPVRERWAELWFSWWHRLLMARDASAGVERVRPHKEKLVTRHVWLSRAELIRRYGSTPVPAEDASAPPRAVVP